MSGLKDSSIAKIIQRVLILGHSGYIGSHLYRFLLEKHPGVEVIGQSFPPLDLTKEDEAMSLSDLFDLNTAVIMCSAIKKQYGDSLDIFLQNMAMVTNVCRLLQKRPVRRFVYFSSAEVYGESVHNTNITEETPVQPSSYYGIAKYTSEGLFRKVFERQEDSSLLILRPTLVYGPGEQGTFYGPSGFVRTALSGNPIILWGDGEELREFVYIDDLVGSVIRLTFHEYDGVVNIVSGQSHTFKEALEIISRLMPFAIQTSSRPRTRSKVDQAYSNKLLTKLLPDIFFCSLEEGIKHVFDAEYQVIGRDRHAGGEES
ncbi:NAD(P)-dependent oxidoreductase [bacterium]|nr:NAD(P)-dependent oxidoreductase [bacterium]